MRDKRLDQLVPELEYHLEKWKRLSHFLGLARGKKFNAEDEKQFLELKAGLIQELETIMAQVEFASPSRDEIHTLLSAAPSIRHLSEGSENVLRNVEIQWHRIFLAWQSVLGQLKVKQDDLESQSYITSFFVKKK